MNEFGYVDLYFPRKTEYRMFMIRRNWVFGRKMVFPLNVCSEQT